MIDVQWAAFVLAGAACLVAGILGWAKNPNSKAAIVFMAAMTCIFLAASTGPLIGNLGTGDELMADLVAKVFSTALLVGTTCLWLVALFFTKERETTLRPVTPVGAVILAAPLIMILLGLFARVSEGDDGALAIEPVYARVLVLYAVSSVLLAMTLTMVSMSGATDTQRRSATIYMVGLCVFAASGVAYGYTQFGSLENHELYALSVTVFTIGIAASGVIFAYSIASGQMMMMAPVPEALASSSKATYKLLHRRTYLVEEPKPDFSFRIFTDILKGRCSDCESDDSFPCESIECSTCRLPCPCRTCGKYRSRPHGLVVTRQFPKEVRSKYFLQTTPIIWLSTVAGKDNMDPAKLTLLSDMLVGFMEKSPNGVVLVDGLEYLVTTNDFQRVLKAVDRWGETAMSSTSSLIISLDPNAFDERELAMIEKNKEIVSPDDEGTWHRIKVGT